VQWRVQEWFPNLSADELEKLRLFHEELVKFNKTINLISVATVPTADLVHFADCILGAKAVLEKVEDKEIYDLGSGNGLPGIILAILAPNRKIICVDRDQRKSEFLKHVATTLKLTNVEVKVANIETLPANSVACGISRGFASVSKAILATRKVFSVNGHYFHMKGDIWGRELAEIPSQLCSYWEPALLAQYSLPSKGEKRAVVLTKKIQA
jgi:16S rRNA (guanine527-N7)-methyltransferase